MWDSEETVFLPLLTEFLSIKVIFLTSSIRQLVSYGTPLSCEFLITISLKALSFLRSLIAPWPCKCDFMTSVTPITLFMWP